jgi:hypothetical protein
MAEHSRDTFAFVVIFAVCLAGAFKQPWWAAAAGACILVILSLTQRWRFATIEVPDSTQLAASSFNGVAIAGAAFGSGHGLGWMWGI